MHTNMKRRIRIGVMNGGVGGVGGVYLFTPNEGLGDWRGCSVSARTKMV